MSISIIDGSSRRRNNIFPYYLNVSFLILILILNTTLPWDPDTVKKFPDAGDYLKQSNLSIFDLNFYLPSPDVGFYSRTFTVPLFFKLVRGNPDSIIMLQRIIYSIAIFFLSASLILFINSLWIKCILICVIYLFSSWWTILGWSGMILSESLSTAFLFLWLASLLFWMYRPGKEKLILHLLITFLFAFTRDSWPITLVAFYGLVTIIFIIGKHSWTRLALFILAFSIVILFFQNYSVIMSERITISITNSIMTRIVSNPKYLSWFEKEGMPQAKELGKNFSDLKIEVRNERKRIYQFYYNSDYAAFHFWVRTKGQKKYIKFMVEHPEYTFLINEDPIDRTSILATDMSPYSGKVTGYASFAENYFPIFSWQYLAFVSIILLLIFRVQKKMVFVLPALLIFVFLLNIIITYNGDSLEKDRHLFITNVMIQFLSLWSTVMILDTINYDRVMSLISPEQTHKHKF